MQADDSGNVMVVCRARPFNKKELEKGADCCLDFHPDKKAVQVNLPDPHSSQPKQYAFAFDHCFDMNTK